MPGRPPRLRSPGPLRLAFIGARGINRVHRELLALQPSLVRMAGVADPDPSRAAALAADFQAPVFAEDGAMATYHEIRTLRCRQDTAGRSYVWTWRSQRAALRPHRLIQSEWSLPASGDRKINYHGLGLRLPWAWAFSGDRFNGTERDGVACAPGDALGTTGSEVAMWGLIDGHWTPPRARVALRQDLGFAWFVLKGDFAYLAVGPSNAGPLDVAAGQRFDESYEIEVADLPAA